MKGLFPLNIKIGQIQGVISILKEYNGQISLQELSDEALEQADDLVIGIRLEILAYEHENDIWKINNK